MTDPSPAIHTNGGAYISGSVNTGGGMFVGRDYTVTLTPEALERLLPQPYQPPPLPPLENGLAGYEPQGLPAGSMVPPAGLTGMGGIGKTQIAVEFCYRYGQFFHGVHWIDARQTDSIPTSPPA